MSAFPHLALRVDSQGGVTRRSFLGALGVLGGLGWARPLPTLADELRRQGRSCILLWMAGGPSQFETLDPKPGAPTQGPTSAIPTAVPGIHIAERMPRMASVIKDLTLIRSMTSREGNHGRATYLLHTSYAPSG